MITEEKEKLSYVELKNSINEEKVYALKFKNIALVSTNSNYETIKMRFLSLFGVIFKEDIYRKSFCSSNLYTILDKGKYIINAKERRGLFNNVEYRTEISNRFLTYLGNNFIFYDDGSIIDDKMDLSDTLFILFLIKYNMIKGTGEIDLSKLDGFSVARNRVGSYYIIRDNKFLKCKKHKKDFKELYKKVYSYYKESAKRYVKVKKDRMEENKKKIIDDIGDALNKWVSTRTSYKHSDESSVMSIIEEVVNNYNDSNPKNRIILASIPKSILGFVSVLFSKLVVENRELREDVDRLKKYSRKIRKNNIGLREDVRKLERNNRRLIARIDKLERTVKKLHKK